MAKKRMGTKGDDGLLATAAMVRKFSERISDYESSPRLSEVLVELLNGKKVPGAPARNVSNRIIQLLQIQ